MPAENENALEVSLVHYRGTIPSVILVASGHSHDTNPPYGDWASAQSVLQAGEQALSRMYLTRPESYLDHFEGGAVVALNLTKLREFANQVNGVLKEGRSPFGTPTWVEFELEVQNTASLLENFPEQQPLLMRVAFDGFHFTAWTQLPDYVQPGKIYRLHHPWGLESELQQALGIKAEIHWHLGYEWENLPDTKYPERLYKGLVYLLEEFRSLVMVNPPTIHGRGSTQVAIWLGVELRETLPLHLAERESLFMRANRLYSLLENSRSEPLDIGQAMPLQQGHLSAFSLQTLQDSYALAQRQAMRHTQQGKLLQLTERFLTGVKAYAEWGMNRRMHAPSSGLVMGPVALHLEPQRGYYSAHHIKMPRQATLTLGHLRGLIERIAIEQKQCERDFSIFTEAVGVTSSLLSAQATERSLKVAEKYGEASKSIGLWALIVAIVSIVVTVIQALK